MMQIQHKNFANLLDRIDMKKNLNVIRKAIEVDSLIKTKSPEIMKRLNESCKGLLCLDVACELLRVPFDSSRATVVAVARRSLYNSKRNMILKILQMSKVLSVRDVILKLEIFPFDVLEETANRILAKYKEQSSFCDETNPTAISAMCVYYAGKIEKIKISVKIVQTISNLSTSQWRAMIKLWKPWASKVERKKKLKERRLASSFRDILNRIEAEPESPKKPETVEKEEESYDDWAKKIIKEARMEIRKRKKVKTIEIL